MADTARSLTDLQSLLADNNAGNISAQDMRDVLVSALGVYGSLSVLDGATQQNDPNTGAKLTCFTTNGNSNGTTPDHTNDQITINVAGNYDIAFQCSFAGQANSTMVFRLRIDGVESPFGCTRKVGSGGDVGSASFLAPGITLAATDVLTVYVEADGATDDLTVTDAQFSVRMVG